jgi:hypothetical protein
MLVCNHCGKIIEESELGYGYEPHGERTPDCCSCGGDFIEATQCKICGEWFDGSDLHGVCEACLEENETVGEALEYGKERTEDVRINGFVANVLSVEHINKILEKWVEENFIDHGTPTRRYLENDVSEYSEYLIDKYGE